MRQLYHYMVQSGVIASFQHKGLEGFFRTGNKKGIRAQHAKRIAHILFLLHHAEKPSDLTDLNRLHFLHGDLEGFFAVNVSGNWRIIGRFKGKDVELVDYLDYH